MCISQNYTQGNFGWCATVARRVWLVGVVPCPTARWGGGLGTPQSGWHGNAQTTHTLRIFTDMILIRRWRITRLDIKYGIRYIFSMQDKHNVRNIDGGRLRAMYSTMLTIRLFEEKVAFYFSRGLIHGTTHLYVGEEATATGVCAQLSDADLITSTHRGHGHCIAKGIDLKRMFAELFGKEAGYCKGKGGSMHIADLTRGNLGANGIVGGGIPIAVGAAMTQKKRKNGKVVVCFFGDGALNQGCFHEAANMASIWDLPVLFVCENNQYGMSMSSKRAFNIADLSVRAKSYGIPGKTIDGNNIFEVYGEVKKALSHVRKKGPALLVAHTYRFLGHSKSDANRYRTKEEIAEWKERDPIGILEKYLLTHDTGAQAFVDGEKKRIKEQIEEAIAYTESLPYPALSTLEEDIYA